MKAKRRRLKEDKGKEEVVNGKEKEDESIENGHRIIIEVTVIPSGSSQEDSQEGDLSQQHSLQVIIYQM